ncbi:MAG: adenosylcobalamin-dependent ribonucleoside-diphosphate reductase [Bacteroidia bacterium]
MNKASKSEIKLTYTYQEVFEKCLHYFKDDELAASTWINKYAMKNMAGKFIELSPDDMHVRMSKEFLRIENKYNLKQNDEKIKLLSKYGQTRATLTEQNIYAFFKNFKYIIPQGSVMSSLGNPNIIASLSNCVVLPKIYDSYGGVLYTDQQLAQLFKRRCGVGIDISTLRPSGMLVKNVSGSATGAVSFMERFSNTTREVAQNGRRGALMITMDIAHPDVEDFITIKQNLLKVTGANISVRLSDEFMKAVITNTEYLQRFPIDAKIPEYFKTINARELWNLIIASAHQSAEPGLIFWDKQHTYSTSSVYPEFKNVSTNPCSEIAMQGGDSCRLIALNLFNFINNPFTKNAQFDYEKFYKIVYEAQRLMDDLVDLELEAIEKIISKVKADPEPNYIKQIELETWQLLYESGKKGRRTGLGFTALSDTMAGLNFKFDSNKAIAEIEKIMRTKCEAEFESTIDMGIERGKFNAFDPVIENTSEFIQMMEKEFPTVYNRMMKYGRRNISISTVAPTGTLSILAQSSSGIEPVFMLSYKRRKKINTTDKNVRVDYVDAMGDSWQEYIVYHPKLKEWMNVNNTTSLENNPYEGSTAKEIDWMKRIELQAVVQKYTTHSISSTINLETNVSVENVGEIYLAAWKKGLKGITIYRDNSRAGVLIADKEEVNQLLKNEKHPQKRPTIINAEVVRFLNQNEKWIAVIGLIDEKPYEIFTGKVNDTFSIPKEINSGWIVKRIIDDKKKRYDFQYINEGDKKITMEGLSNSFNKEYWNYAKLISGMLRFNMPLLNIINMIENLHLYSDNINTWKAGVGRALKKYIPNGTIAATQKCPECNESKGLVYEEGCLTCKNCGYSLCG